MSDMFRMRYSNVLVAIVFAVITVLAAGCSTSVKEVPSIPARNRNFQFEQNYSDANHIYYAPKGLFITNIRKEEFPENSWIRLTPGEQWPSYESRPTVLTGRIAERKKD